MTGLDNFINHYYPQKLQGKKLKTAVENLSNSLKN